MSELNGNSRLDRIERALDLLIADHVQFREEHKQLQEGHKWFQEEHKRLLTAQVVLTDRMDKLTQRIDKLAERVDRFAELGAHTDERLNALIRVVGGIVRRQQ